MNPQVIHHHEIHHLGELIFSIKVIETEKLHYKNSVNVEETFIVKALVVDVYAEKQVQLFQAKAWRNLEKTCQHFSNQFLNMLAIRVNDAALEANNTHADYQKPCCTCESNNICSCEWIVNTSLHKIPENYWYGFTSIIQLNLTAKTISGGRELLCLKDKDGVGHGLAVLPHDYSMNLLDLDEFVENLFHTFEDSMFA